MYSVAPTYPAPRRVGARPQRRRLLGQPMAPGERWLVAALTLVLIVAGGFVLNHYPIQGKTYGLSLKGHRLSAIWRSHAYSVTIPGHHVRFVIDGHHFHPWVA